MISNLAHKNVFGFKQKQAQNTINFGAARTPANAEKLVKRAETAWTKGEKFKSLDLFEKAIKKAETEVAEGKLKKETFAEMCINASKKLLEGTHKAFNDALKTTNNAFNAGKGNKEIEQKIAEHVTTVDSQIIGTQKGLNNIANQIIQNYEAQSTTKLNKAANKLNEENIKNQLAALEETKEYLKKDHSMGFIKKNAPKAANKPTENLTAQQAANKVNELNIKFALEAAEEAKAQLAKKKQLGFVPPSKTPAASSK